MSDSDRRPTTLSDGWLALVGVAIFLFCMALVVFEFPNWVYDFVRFVLLFECLALFVSTALIVRIYFKNFKRAPMKARLLPRHVVQLGVMVLLLVFSLTFWSFERTGTDPIWYGLPFLMPAMTVGCLGLFDMLRWLPHRDKSLRLTGNVVEEK